jgi:hypothetical protein
MPVGEEGVVQLSRPDRGKALRHRVYQHHLGRGYGDKQPWLRPSARLEQPFREPTPLPQDRALRAWIVVTPDAFRKPRLDHHFREYRAPRRVPPCRFQSSHNPPELARLVDWRLAEVVCINSNSRGIPKSGADQANQNKDQDCCHGTSLSIDMAIA